MSDTAIGQREPLRGLKYEPSSPNLTVKQLFTLEVGIAYINNMEGFNGINTKHVKAYKEVVKNVVNALMEISQ